MRCVMTLKDAGAMERAVGALARYRYSAGGEAVAPEGHPGEWTTWLLEIDSEEVETIRDHADDGDIVSIKPVGGPASSEIH